MTEQEWLACTDPQKMLEFIQGKTSERKLRLFVVGCSRSVWERIIDQSWRSTIHKAELYADNLLTKDELDRLEISLFLQFVDGRLGGTWTAEGDIPSEVQAWAITLCTVLKRMSRLTGMNAWRLATQLVRPHIVALLHDVFGNPSGSIVVDPSWATAKVVKMAESIYQDRCFDRLPILADSIEEAGCTNAEMLKHLREPGPHVRGCWVLDLILGKE